MCLQFCNCPKGILRENLKFIPSKIIELHRVVGFFTIDTEVKDENYRQWRQNKMDSK